MKLYRVAGIIGFCVQAIVIAVPLQLNTAPLLDSKLQAQVKTFAEFQPVHLTESERDSRARVYERERVYEHHMSRENDIYHEHEIQKELQREREMHREQ